MAHFLGLLPVGVGKTKGKLLKQSGSTLSVLLILIEGQSSGCLALPSVCVEVVPLFGGAGKC